MAVPSEEIMVPLPQNDYQRIDEIGDFGYPVQLVFFELADLFMSRLRWNWHAELEFFYIKEGHANFLSDDYEIELSKGEAVFINQNIMHAMRLKDNDKDSCGIYSFKFHPAYLFGYGNLSLTNKYIVPLLNSKDLRVLKFTGADDFEKEVLSIFETIIQKNLAMEFGYELETKAELCHLWLLLLKKTMPSQTSSVMTPLSLDEMRVKEAILYIEKNYGNSISLADISNAVHISKSECCRCFKRVLNLTPVEYLTKYRIFQAASILRNHSQTLSSISDLAFQIGFNSASYFNKVFRQYMDCTPNEYRKRIKDNPLEI